ncbi:MAG TPA: hypothetical protein VHT25_02640 [Solirubrobacteraceae bacterium]|jgi:hypothetical protein|nr:hypothetical protein [Solirubrobacteraceae bacterium]
MHDVPNGGRRRIARLGPATARSTGSGFLAIVLVAGALTGPTVAVAAVSTSRGETAERAAVGERGASTLESAASKAGSTGRAVAMSLIGLAFAVAGTVLAFRRDFKEAAGVFAVGIVAVLLATPAGIGLLRDTVNSLFGAP